MLSGQRTKGMLPTSSEAQIIHQGFEIKLATNRIIRAIRAVEKRRGTAPVHITPSTIARLATDPAVLEELSSRKATQHDLSHNREVRDKLKRELSVTRKGPEFHGRKETLQDLRSQLKLSRKILRSRKGALKPKAN